MPDAEEVAEDDERLPPTPTTIKELFAKSGNQCAFPGCRHVVVNEFGDVVAQVAHIIGVKPKSARYVQMDPEEKRLPSNLLILCYEHHNETNDAERFPPEAMREMKLNHERRFGGLVGGLLPALADETKYAATRAPSTMAGYRLLYDTENSKFSDDEIRVVLDDLNAYLEVLSRLPPNARSVLATIVERGDDQGENVFEITTAELREVLNATDVVIGEQLGILQRAGLVGISEDGREGYHEANVWVYTQARQPAGATVLWDLRYLHEKSGVPMSTFIVDLDFSAFDLGAF